MNIAADGIPACNIPDPSADAAALQQRVAQETRPCTVRQMTAEEAAKYALHHPTAAEIHDGAERGLTLEQIAAETGGTPARAWHMARRHVLMDNYRANAAAQGVPMFRVEDVRPAQIMPSVAAQLATNATQPRTEPPVPPTVEPITPSAPASGELPTGQRANQRDDLLQRYPRERVIAALSETGSIREAARVLHISNETLATLQRAYGLTAGKGRSVRQMLQEVAERQPQPASTITREALLVALAENTIRLRREFRASMDEAIAARADELKARDQRIEALTCKLDQLAADNVALINMLANHRHVHGGSWTSTEKYARDPERGVA